MIKQCEGFTLIPSPLGRRLGGEGIHVHPFPVVGTASINNVVFQGVGIEFKPEPRSVRKWLPRSTTVRRRLDPHQTLLLCSSAPRTSTTLMFGVAMAQCTLTNETACGATGRLNVSDIAETFIHSVIPETCKCPAERYRPLPR